MELYIHIPFCIRKCDYCDFLSFPLDGEVRGNYLYALKQELRLAGEQCSSESISSIFIGGGTPSSLSCGEIAGIMEIVKNNYTLDTECEVSIEANPGTLNREKLQEYLSCGINRISLGCQSVIDSELQELGRIHTFREFLENYRQAVEVGFSNINVDLMSAIPGQTVESWEHNLRTVAQLAPEHISAYSLIVEEGTPFYEKDLNLPDEDAERRMYEMTAEILGEYGYHQYEISNYCKPGCECRHNVGYWTRVPYLGLGLGASSLYNGKRFSNTRDMERYLKNSWLAHENVEIITRQDAMEEFMFLGLRMMDGISEAEFQKCFGEDIQTVYGSQIEKLVNLGLMEQMNGHLRLTRQGISVSNQVFVEFLF